MKRYLLALAAAFCCLGTTVAEPVSPAAARQTAQRFLQAKGRTLKSEARRAPSVTEGQPAPAYYVFNADAGFVVVSGDDCVGPNLILGYTAQGRFDATRVPENLQWWLDTMQEQITTLSCAGRASRPAPTLHTDIDTLVTALWNQGDNNYNPNNPYNRFCPDTNGQLCVTGCMATALAQVLYTHRCPQAPLAAPLPAYQLKDGRTMDELPAVTFDWDNMVDDYRQPTTDEQQTAVATLMRYCGQLLQMDYTPRISNAYLYDVHQLATVFGIDPEVSIANAKGYTMSGWDNLLYNELSEGRPLVYAGNSTGGGHAFVIDGYQVNDGSGYYHVNWGWGGTANGYYNISLLAPNYSGTGASSTSDGYNSDQEALIHLQPATTPAATAPRYLMGNGWDENVNGTPHIFMLWNTSYMPGTFTIGLAEIADDGTIDYSRIYKEEDVAFVGYRYATSMGGAYYMIDNIPGSGLTPGRHHLALVNREKLSDNQIPWKPLFGPNNSIEVLVDDDGLFTEMVFHPDPQLTVQAGELTIRGLKQWGLALLVNATITNTGNEDYVGSVECNVYALQGDDVIADLPHHSITGIFIDAGSTAQVHFKASVPRAGKYVLLLAKKNLATNLTGTKLADIENVPGYIAHQTVTIDELQFQCTDLQYASFQDQTGQTYYYLDCGLVNGTPIYYNAAIVANLYYKDNWGNWQPLTFPGVPSLFCPATVYANQSGYYPIYLPQPLMPGEYTVELQMANDFSSFAPADYFTFYSGLLTVEDIPTGIDDVPISDFALGDGSNRIDNRKAINRQWFDLQGRRHVVNPNRNRKGVYVKEGRKVISSAARP